jgi:predicted MFS family arabinose efflux permease
MTVQAPHKADTHLANMHWEWIVVAAAGVLMITMGARQSLGLYVAPIDVSTGVGIAAISFAMAISQFTWGAVQPIAGALADKYGPARVIVGGLVVLAVGNALTPLVDDVAGFTLTIGVLAAAGAGGASFSVLMGAAARLLPPEKRGFASGVINAGGSFGQFVFAPIAQLIISLWGWMVAMWFMAVVALAALPLVRLLRTPVDAGTTAAAPGAFGAAVRSAMGDRSYLLLHAGFFTCGFHIAFLITHLPSEIALCGLPPSVASWSLAIIGLANIAGSLFVGWSVSRYLSKNVLAIMYASRTVMILLYLIAPKTEWTFYIFAFGLGATWLATVPPTATVVGKLFGPRYLSTLFGLTMLSHQVGGFFGAWLGGLAVTRFGDYTLMWYADAAFALIAALLNLPIREPATVRAAAAA